MKQIFILMAIFLASYNKMSAQIYGCSEIPVAQVALTNYPPSATERSDLLIKLYYHLYYDDQGNNGVPTNRPDIITNQLNQNFQGTGFTFFHNNCETRIVNDDKLNESNNRCSFWGQGVGSFDGVDIHVNGDNSPLLASANEVPGNEIVVAGLSPQTGEPISLTNIITHEMGHCLGLLHTHRGTCPEITSLCDGTIITPNQSSLANDFVDDTPRDPYLYDRVDDNCNWDGTIECEDNMGPYTPLTNNYMSY